MIRNQQRLLFRLKLHKAPVKPRQLQIALALQILHVQDLERECNLQLARFNWGFVQLQPEEKALLIAYHALPAGDNIHSPDPIDIDSAACCHR